MRERERKESEEDLRSCSHSVHCSLPYLIHFMLLFSTSSLCLSLSFLSFSLFSLFSLFLKTFPEREREREKLCPENVIVKLGDFCIDFSYFHPLLLHLHSFSLSSSFDSFRERKREIEREREK